jgi:(R)-2-hydroxyacyl-CoA dehydratese activating ATPase
MAAPLYFAGLDIGSTMTKVVLIDANHQIVDKIVEQTGAEHRKLANEVIRTLLEHVNISIDEIVYLVATGYGRINVPFADAQITELTCHSKGVVHLFPSATTVIDVGGQDAKGMRIKGGKLANFVMNDKCAAGTGRFLEVLSEALQVKIEDLGPLSLRAQGIVTISSICTIYAQQEIVAQQSIGKPIEAIVAGVHQAVASRIVRMVKPLGIVGDVVLTGGVAKNSGFVHAVEKELGRSVLIPEDSRISGALGAAIVAKEKYQKAIRSGNFLKKQRELTEAKLYTS